MMRTLFIHGWGGRSSQFPQLHAHARVFTPFTQHSPEKIVETLRTESADVLIGWSTGAHLILKAGAQAFSRYGRIVLIAPFLRFTDSLPERVVRSMRIGMKRAPEKTLAGFYANCEERAPLDFRPEQSDFLAQGLDFLLTSTIDLPHPIEARHVLILHGERDRIVRAKAVNAITPLLQGAKIRRIDAGHKIEEQTLLTLIHEETHSPLF